MKAFQVKTPAKLEVISGDTIEDVMEFYSEKEPFLNGAEITEIPTELWDSVISFNSDPEGERDWVTLTELMEEVTETQLITTGNYQEQ